MCWSWGCLGGRVGWSFFVGGVELDKVVDMVVLVESGWVGDLRLSALYMLERLTQAIVVSE